MQIDEKDPIPHGIVFNYEHSEGIAQYLIRFWPYLIYQGSRGPGSDDKILAEHGISQVLAITNVTLPPIRTACRWILPVDDGKGWTGEQVDFIKTFCEFSPDRDCTKLIHCDHGISRSAGALIIWRMLFDNVDKICAYEWVRRMNSGVNCRQEILDSIPERFHV